ncbi:MAG: thiamine ABC transporter substrate-binding protein [Actinomycetota bacterium]
MKPAIAAVTATIVLGACTTGGPSSDRPRTVTLLTHDSFDVSEQVLKAFETDSGIDVTVLRAGDAGQVVSRAILTAGDPEGDVLFGIDDNLLHDALEAEVFTPYASPRLEAVPDAYEADPDHRVTPIDRGDVCVNVDTASFASTDMPRSFEDLVASADELVVENPATSTPGLAFLLATIAEYGDPGFEDYWTRLRAGGVRVVDGWERAYFGEFSGAGGGEGERALVVSYATSPVAEVVLAEGPAERNTVLEDTCYRQIEFAGILAGAEHPEEARALIDFLLSREVQEDIPLRMFVYPVVDDASLPAVFADNAVIPAAPLSLDAEMVAANRTDWVQRWTDVVLR